AGFCHRARVRMNALGIGDCAGKEIATGFCAMRRLARIGMTAATGFWLLATTSCAPDYTLVSHFNENAVEGDGAFGYRKWVSRSVEQDVVVIGIHGFCGASIDYENLGKHLLKRQPRTGLYAYEVRGQGSDPIHARRGDIGNPKDW